MHPEKPLILATIWPKTPSPAGGSPFAHPGRTCDLVAPTTACPAASGAKAGSCGARGVAVGMASPGAS